LPKGKAAPIESSFLSGRANVVAVRRVREGFIRSPGKLRKVVNIGWRSLVEVGKAKRRTVAAACWIAKTGRTVTPQVALITR